MGRFSTGTNDFTKGKAGTVIRFGQRNNHLSNGPKKGLKYFQLRMPLKKWIYLLYKRKMEL